MHRFIFFAAMVSIGLFALNGCSQYVEQPTPPGQVAPPIHPIQAKPYRNPYAEATPPSPAQRSQHATPTPAQPIANGPIMNGSILVEFEDIYFRTGAKRIAIFLNRALSDEVREWQTKKRAVLSVQGELTRQDGETTETFKGPGGASSYYQTHSKSAERESPDESWMWQFEEGFLEPFLSIGANIVDRATIMRLTAAQSGQQGNAYNPMAVKKIEMDSLRGKADLFVEILIRRAPASKIGYEFKATAKEVNTGIIRANVTSINWQYGGLPQVSEKVIATDTGYKFVEDKDAEYFPEVSVVARDLSLALMKSLARSWQRVGGRGGSG